jgi:hypothetical protein
MILELNFLSSIILFISSAVWWMFCLGKFATYFNLLQYCFNFEDAENEILIKTRLFSNEPLIVSEQ